ncbi:methyltransferase domain-containing protein [Spirosoma fluviale]|uniref:Ubiquinone/menaquinone biosynthesis C-methylase UbiE n=1 Tax=Spirosoma fluviale TaxID=1597977 RepID=A0A286F9V3_9BACT|nr:methyltransferase domain-containing protein [Spirosoma fluviale]SOD79980.1 Ubiquinone/menaquinone biosynthesis C-methylase UbiE [Spirosoma fluviale]
MTDQSGTGRATMPAGHNPVLERRTVENANRNLLKYLKPGLSVLDVGCGTGAITRSIAEKIGPTGSVLGIDPNQNLIELAKQQAGDTPGLDFQQADVYAFDTPERFDLVTCARTLQWLAEPELALRNMKRFVKPGGHLAILDFNHEKISWTPEPPGAMKLFYDAFLNWRQDAGFDNAIADNLKTLMHFVGFDAVQVEEQFEITRRNDPDFSIASRLWAEVAELRGPQLVQDGYITENQRLEAIRNYDNWIATVGQSMTVYLLAVESQQPL